MSKLSLVISGLMVKYGYENNINTLDIRDIATQLCDEGDNIDKWFSAHFYHKGQKGVFTHVFLQMDKEYKKVFRVYVGKTNRCYLGSNAKHVFSRINNKCNVVETLSWAFDQYRMDSPVTHIEMESPVTRGAISIHGVVMKFLDIIRR